MTVEGDADDRVELIPAVALQRHAFVELDLIVAVGRVNLQKPALGRAFLDQVAELAERLGQDRQGLLRATGLDERLVDVAIPAGRRLRESDLVGLEIDDEIANGDLCQAVVFVVHVAHCRYLLPDRSR